LITGGQSFTGGAEGPKKKITLPIITNAWVVHKPPQDGKRRRVKGGKQPVQNEKTKGKKQAWGEIFVAETS